MLEIQLYLLSDVMSAHEPGTESFSKNRKIVSNMYDDLLDMYYNPFGEKVDPQTRMVDDLSTKWTEEFGDVSDPKTSAAIDKAVSEMLLRSKKK